MICRFRAPPRVRHRRLVRRGRNAAASRSASARLLRRGQQAHLRRARGHGDACQGSRRSAAAIGAASPQDFASERPAATQDSLRIAPRSVSGALGRAEACRRDHLFDLDSRRSLASHGLRRAPIRQAGDRCPAGSLTRSIAPIGDTANFRFGRRADLKGMPREGPDSAR
jgi:hypothetical protein